MKKREWERMKEIERVNRKKEEITKEKWVIWVKKLKKIRL